MEYKKLNQPYIDENNTPIKLGVSDNLEKLKSLFPSVVKDGFVDFTALKEELGEIEEATEGMEKYNLSWWGKQKAKEEAQYPPVSKTLNFKENGNDNFTGETENLYIEGDNLEVLKLLKENYYGKIKMIYIDPPYNTGKDFVYKDNFHMSAEESNIADGVVNEDGERLEKRFVENTKGNRYHSNWLNMIYPRLKVAHQLLKEDGVIFISIDDNEVHNLRKVCDEIFGEDNFVGEIIRKTKSMTGDNGNGFNLQHESLIMYGSNKEAVYLLGNTKDFSNYKNPDNDKNGDWCSGDPSAKSGGISTSFEIKNPITGKVDYPPAGRFWAFSKETFISYVESGRIKFKEVYKDNERGFIFKRYKNSVEEKRNPVNSLFGVENEYMNQSATTELKELFRGSNFSYPKPVCFLKEIIKYATSSNDIILDFFSGSATTAHAVMSLNAEDGGNRKFIMVQLPELTDEKSEAYKNGYKNICEIGKERIRRAGNKIVEELAYQNMKKIHYDGAEASKEYLKYYIENTNRSKDKELGIIIDDEILKNYNKEQQENINDYMLNSDEDSNIEDVNDKDKYIKNPLLLDIGFKVFEVGKTNMKWNDFDSIEDIQNLEELQMAEKDRFDFNPHFTDENVVYEIGLLQRGVPLSSKIEKLSDIGERTYLYANSYLVCLDEVITDEMLEKIAKIQPQPIAYYLRDSAFGTNIAQKNEVVRTFEEFVSNSYGRNLGSYILEFI